MSQPSTPSPRHRPSQASSARYRVEELLGQGGMATVHRAIEVDTNAVVALKRLRVDRAVAENSALVALFEREYLTLSELAHPHVVQVLDYGIDADGPYYTMELLDGGDLQALSPVPWPEACSYARDVCSALALLHSRRTIYRDLSPRNVRCTAHGAAKLLDFGATAPMGPAREIVGTAPCVAPESLNMQALDARTDLFALGATLYFALAQRHAYPAHDLSQLRDVWRSRPRRLLELSPDLPPALDELVMDLLQLDISMRPPNVGEVLERLSAILGVRSSEPAQVAQAYLATPSLVARQPQLSYIRKATFRALQKQGGSLLITGAPGVGRSRLLDASVLEAKLAGLLVVRIHGNDAADGSESALVRSIARSLLESARALATSAAEEQLEVLQSVIPELRGDGAASPSPANDAIDSVALAQAMESWLRAVARRKPLLLAVDDFAALDERSAALLAVLAERTKGAGILLIVTTPSSRSAMPARAALHLLETRSDQLTLEALTVAQVEELLASIFGQAPNLAALANYLHRVADGNPRDTLQLAQQLVAEQLIQYADGHWSLPDRVRLNVLPASVGDALEERAHRLSNEARKLAIAFALEPTLLFSLEECGAFAPELAQRTLFRTLEDLVMQDVLQLVGPRYGLRQQAWVDALLGAAAPEAKSAAHGALALVLERRGDEVRASGHRFAAGDSAAGLDLLLRHVEITTQATDRNASAFFELLRELPPDWLPTYEHALTACRELERPARQAALLMSRLEGLISHAISDVCAYHHIQGRLEQLRVQCGLDLFAALPEELPEAERMQRAFHAANERFEALPDEQRVYAPTAAVRQLAHSLLSAVGVIAFTHDTRALRDLPSLAPLAALFPAMRVVRDLVDGVALRVTGRTEHALAVYDALLAGPFAEAGDDLGHAHQTATRLRLLLSAAALEAAMGNSHCLERILEVEQHASHAAQAMLVRHLYFAWQGEANEAERCRRQAEVLQVHSSTHHGFEGQHLFGELGAYALSDDLTRVRYAVDAIEARARIHEAWRPMLHYARGEFQRIRGDLVTARRELELSLSFGSAGEHPLWAMAAGAHLRVCVELGEYEQAAEHGQTYLAEAARAELGYARAYVAMPCSVALAYLGRLEDAVTMAETALESFRAVGAAGLNVALAHETRARIALLAGDRELFEERRKRAIEAWPPVGKRLARVLAQVTSDGDVEPNVIDERAILSEFAFQLEDCQSASLRAACGLEFLVEQSGARGGLLYLCAPSGLRRVAVAGSAEPSDTLDARAADYLDTQREVGETTDAEALRDDGPETEGAVDESPLRPVLLLHSTARGLSITGVALLVSETLAPFRPPLRIAGELSRYLAECGDAVPLDA